MQVFQRRVDETVSTRLPMEQEEIDALLAVAKAEAEKELASIGLKDGHQGLEEMKTVLDAHVRQVYDQLGKRNKVSTEQQFNIVFRDMMNAFNDSVYEAAPVERLPLSMEDLIDIKNKARAAANEILKAAESQLKGGAPVVARLQAEFDDASTAAFGQLEKDNAIAPPTVMRFMKRCYGICQWM